MNKNESSKVNESLQLVAEGETRLKQYDEPLLDKNNMRFTVFPIQYNQIWDFYKKSQSLFWKAEEIDFSKDKKDFEDCLTTDEQHFIERVLSFFASSDGIVNFNLRERFLNDITVLEIQVAYSWQMMMENIHGEVYSLMLDKIISDVDKRNELFNAISNSGPIKEMADWQFKWIESTESFAHRLVAFSIVEGVFFSGMFAAIFWLKKYRSKGKYFMNGLFKSNEFIARDEGLHTDFACMLYGLLVNKLPKQAIYDMFDGAILIAQKFMRDAIRTDLIGMNNELMADYIEFIADRLLVNLGYSKKYNKKNPFTFMDTIGMEKKTNFFEHRVTDYKSAHNKNVERRILILDDF